MKKMAKHVGIALTVILLLSVIPEIESRADNNPYSAWISIFDPVYYSSNNAAAASYANGDITRLWQYFVNVGIPKCDQASAEFNVLIYAKNYPELVQTYGGNIIQYYIHYATVGKQAGMNARTLNSISQISPKNLLDCHIMDKVHTLSGKTSNITDDFGNTYHGNGMGFWASTGRGSYVVFNQVSDYTYLSGILTPDEGMYRDCSYTVEIYADNNLVYTSPTIVKYTSPVNFDV